MRRSDTLKALNKFFHLYLYKLHQNLKSHLAVTIKNLNNSREIEILQWVEAATQRYSV